MAFASEIFSESEVTAIYEICREYLQAARHYPPMNSAHEGVSVLREEFEELWDEVKVKQSARDLPKMRYEAVQTAAMALRFIVDICSGEEAGQK